MKALSFSEDQESLVLSQNKVNEISGNRMIIVHPNQKTIIPFAPEAIVKQDGKTKMIAKKMPEALP